MARFSLLDRSLLWRGARAIVLILLLAILLVFGLEFVLRFNALTAGSLDEGDSRIALILHYYLLRIPELTGPLLTIATMAAGLVVMGPMLKRRELVALCAAGLSLRRITLPLLALALLVGLVDVIVRDQVNPRLEGPRAALLDKLEDTTRLGRSWRAGEAAWFANAVRLHEQPPSLHEVIVAPDAGGLYCAESLVWRDGWQLQGQVIHWDQTAGTRQMHPQLPCEGDLALPLQPAELARVLVSRYAMTTTELLAAGDRVSRAFAYRRLIAGCTPLLALMASLAIFVRFANAGHLMTAAIRALVVGAIPAGLLAVGNRTLETSPLPPELTSPLAVLVAALPALLVYSRWRL